MRRVKFWMPAAGEIAGYDPAKKNSPPVADDGYHPPERDTSFVCVVDKWGNCYDWSAGAVCAIKRDEKTGRLEGGADPRRPTGIA
jgi:gamma-glutamyltranspeptidase